MPKQTFFNLPEDKRKTLIEAAEKEFSRVPVFDASIANIIKLAGIPRGSFYQYFEDKEDLFFYLLDEKLKASKAFFIQLLIKHNGDFIEAMMELYDNFLKVMPDEEERNFIKNALLYATNAVENSITDMFTATYDNHGYREILELIDQERLNINSEEELFHIFKIVSALAFHNLIEKITKELDDEEAMRNFTVRIELIKRGLSK